MSFNLNRHSNETFRKEPSTRNMWSNQNSTFNNDSMSAQNHNAFRSSPSPSQIKNDANIHGSDGHSKVETFTNPSALYYGNASKNGLSTIDSQPATLSVLPSVPEDRESRGTGSATVSYHSSFNPTNEQTSTWTSPTASQPRNRDWLSLVDSDSAFMESASNLSKTTNQVSSPILNQQSEISSTSSTKPSPSANKIALSSPATVRSFFNKINNLIDKESKSQQWNSVIGSKRHAQSILKVANDGNSPSNQQSLEHVTFYSPKDSVSIIDCENSYHSSNNSASSNKVEQLEKDIEELTSSTKLEESASNKNFSKEKRTIEFLDNNQETTLTEKSHSKFEEAVQKEVDFRLENKQAELEKEKKNLVAKSEYLTKLEAKLKKEESRLKEFEGHLKTRERLLNKAPVIPNIEAQLHAEQQQELNRIKNELVAQKKHDDDIFKKRKFKNIEDFNKFDYPQNTTQPIISEGRIKYDISFMKLFADLCTATNADLSLLQSTFGSKSEYQIMTTQIARDKYSNYVSTPTLHDGTRFNSNNRPLSFHTNSFGSVFERPSNNYNTGTKFRSNIHTTHPSMSEYISPVAPLKKSENRWVPASSKQGSSAIAADGILSEDVITRKTKALLNKLTMEKFDSISGQIFEYCQQSKKENDGKALRTVIRLTFEKACDEPAFSAMWAKLCQAMRDKMTDDIVDETLKDKDNMPISGVPLFRTYLFVRCQQEFESGWKTKMPDLAAGEMLTDEYYAAAKAKRQGLGLIQLIGELYKLGMLSDKVIYGCLVKLCDDPASAVDEDVESLCKLLSTVGKALDSKPKTSPWLDEFIARIQNEMSASEKLTSRAKFMIMDLIELRGNQWIPQHGANQSEPTTLSQIREQADKATPIKKSFRY